MEHLIGKKIVTEKEKGIVNRKRERRKGREIEEGKGKGRIVGHLHAIGIIICTFQLYINIRIFILTF